MQACRFIRLSRFFPSSSSLRFLPQWLDPKKGSNKKNPARLNENKEVLITKTKLIFISGGRAHSIEIQHRHHRQRDFIIIIFIDNYFLLFMLSHFAFGLMENEQTNTEKKRNTFHSNRLNLRLREWRRRWPVGSAETLNHQTIPMAIVLISNYKTRHTDSQHQIMIIIIILVRGWQRQSWPKTFFI